MGSNQHRSTAGKTLLSFAILAMVVAAFTVYLRVNRDRDERIEYPTGLGDEEYYSDDLGPGFDLFLPNLVFEGIPEDLKPGLYRINHAPREIEDEKMRQLVREKGDRHWVYVRSSKSGKSVRYYLKESDNSYIEFGKQKYFPEPDDKRPGSVGDPEPAESPDEPSGEDSGNS